MLCVLLHLLSGSESSLAIAVSSMELSNSQWHSLLAAHTSNGHLVQGKIQSSIVEWPYFTKTQVSSGNEGTEKIGMSKLTESL